MRKQIMLAIGLALGAGTVALAETADEQQACMNDAFQVCGDAIPDREKVFHCLVDKRREISPGCRIAMAPYLPAEPVVAMKKSPPQHAKTAKVAKTKGPLNITPH